MEQYDSDMDGTITKEELPENFQRLFDHADADKNGTLSKKEIAAVAVDYVKALT
jgi:Ca2+-binding EF-hand superfamily protein